MAFEFKLLKRVEFSETDMAGIMHFSNFFRYMEMTEHAFLRSLGVSVHDKFDGVLYGWPRVNVNCDFEKPLKFEDQVEVHLSVAKKGNKSIRYAFVFQKIENEIATVVIARGSVTAACVKFTDDGKIAGAATIPKQISDRIEQAPTDIPI